MDRIEVIDLHLYWDGPFRFSDLPDVLNDERRDYGVYQVYGPHSIYGDDVLNYIGKASEQTFGVRISQEAWQFVQDPKRVRIYVGRLAGRQQPDEDTWARQIDAAEKLLIHSHLPAQNTANLNSIPIDTVRELHVFNWGAYRALFPEVSGARYTDVYDDVTEETIYEM